MKAVAMPFKTRLGPILDSIDESYAVLKEQAEMQWMICGFRWQLQAQTEWAWLKQSQGRVLEVLEGMPSKSPHCVVWSNHIPSPDLVRQDRISNLNQARVIEGGQ